ncbi:MAG: LamG domain-containing protein [Planctomycetales bacterium]|nr:LamG domain-containing protein [Planctomycetales bacterium]
MMHCKKLTIAALFLVLFSLPSYGEGILVAHYEFEDPDDCGKDSSGMGNDADEVFEVEQVDGVFGNGAFFDETLQSNFVKYDGLEGFTGKPGVTLAAWVRLDEATTGFDGIISQDAGGCCQNRILLHPNQQPFINLSEHDDRHLTASEFFEFDEWMHIAMTGLDIDGVAEARVYVNGEEVEDSPQIFPEMDDGSLWNLYLGAGEAGNVHFLTGSLDDVRVYEGALDEDEILALLTGGGGGGLRGDFNNNNALDADDIELLSAEVRAGTITSRFDLNNDQKVDAADRTVWIKEERKTWVGDSNLDGEFNSTDFVSVFAAGEYEDATAQNSTWAEGDWNGDADFDSSDFVAAFTDGGYEMGARPPAAAVPEPNGYAALAALLLPLFFRRKRS